MLTVDTLKQNTALQGLSDDQLSAIAEMSKNDENAVIGTRIGALHGQYDADIFGITGVKKRDGEKSYDYAKRVLGDYKSKLDSAKTLKDDLAAANSQIESLQAKLEKGVADETLKQQLRDSQAQVGQLQAKLKTEEATYKAKEEAFAKQLKDIHVDYAFQEATQGLKFKAGITEPIQKTLLSAAKAEILAKGTPDFVDDGQGGKKLVLRGADGNILNNPKNNLNPYTFKEMIMETSIHDVLDEGRRQTGGGTGGFGAGGRANTANTVDLSGVKTQVEADKAIESYLLSAGLTRDSMEFGRRLKEIRTENNVASLPIR